MLSTKCTYLTGFVAPRKMGTFCREQCNEEAIAAFRRKLDLASKKNLKLSQELQHLKGDFIEFMYRTKKKAAYRFLCN